jgi:uncharacterized protein (TIGR00255 family)
MKSMTGYGHAALEFESQSLSVEISSINKKGLEILVHLPREWQTLEREISELIRSKINRGRVRISITVSDLSQHGCSTFLDHNSVAQELESLRAFCSEQKIEFSPDASLVFRINSSIREQRFIPSVEQIKEALLATTVEASNAMVEMRTKEGKALHEDLLFRTNQLSTILEKVEKAVQGMAVEWKQKLLSRLKESGLDITDDDDKVSREVALFADKSDVSEEITRIRSHLEQFLDCLQTTGQVGRKLEFITQELLREFNTLGSKSIRTECSQLTIDAKVELEKIREQILNIE